ncbi:MAG TPA: hypothetical protein VNK95_21310 [Caldilineaceae bacterium]|nr:hypothetical protein [Caldilineaceae bacterium]
MQTKGFGSLSMLFAGTRARSVGARLLRLARPVVIALLIVALVTANVSAAVIQSNLTPSEVQQIVHQTLQQIRPALYQPLDEVLPSALQIMLDAGKLDRPQHKVFYQVFVLGEAPANQPEIAHALTLPKAEQVLYSLQRLQESGALNEQEVKLFKALLAAPDEEVRGQAAAALESGSYGLLATTILQVAVGLSHIDTSADLQTCEATSSSLRAQGWLGDALKWVGGLVKSVIGGALFGAWVGGALFGNWGRTAGAIIGGIWGGVKYIQDTTGNGFMAGPNGEDCTGWPKPF